MAQLVTHLKQSIIADGPDPNQINPSDWNKAHVFGGGALGSLLMRDTSDATYGASWLATVATGSLLISNGVSAAPSWLATVAAGGLLMSTGVGAVPSWLASVAAGSVLISNGVGAVPSWSASPTLASLTVTGNQSIGGVLSVSGFGSHAFVAGGTGGISIAVRNTLAGSGNAASVWIGNDLDQTMTVIACFSSTYTGGGYAIANSTSFTQSGAGGLSLTAAHASGVVRVFAGGPASERMRVTATGEVLIGTTTQVTSSKLALVADGTLYNPFVIQNSNASSTTFMALFVNSGGGNAGAIQQTAATTVAYLTTSDARLKHDDGQAVDLTALRAVVVHDFRWKADGVRARGVFAQEAHDLFPHAVSIGTDDLTERGALAHPWMTDYSKFVPDLIVGWQQHEQRLDALETARASRS